jgi:broad-specificity NMP kinase
LFNGKTRTTVQTCKKEIYMIIGICGLIGCGKGTVGDILVDQGFVKVSFADKLKDGVAEIFGWDRAMLEGDTDVSRTWREQRDNFWSDETQMEVTPRLVLQLFGTDCMMESG